MKDNKIYISKRLQIVAKQIKGKVVADIGCDSANLAIWLAQNKNCFVYATDVRKGPLQKAKINVEKFQMGHQVKLIQSDGLKNVPKNVNEIVIAGMGGQLIERIILECEWIKNSNVFLVLQPQSFAVELKQNISAAGFSIAREIPVIEKDKAYLVICAYFSGICTKLSLYQALVGGFEFSNKIDAKCYIDIQKDKINRALKGLAIAKDTLENIKKKQQFKKRLSILNDWK